MGGRPRVLLVVEQLRRPVPGGIGTYAAGLLQGLDALPDGPDVTLLASRPPRGGDPLARFGRPVAASPLPGRLLTRAWDYALVPAPAGFGVVHAVSLATPLPRRPGETRLVVTVHDLAWRQHPETTTGRGRRWHEAALGRVLRQADAFVVPSAAVAADLTEAGARAERISVITEGADHLAAPDAPAAARRLAAAGVSGPYLLSVGTREPRKNLTRLVEAHRRAASRYPAPWPLVLVGPQGWGGDAAAQGGAAGVVGLGPLSTPGPSWWPTCRWPRATASPRSRPWRRGCRWWSATGCRA
jgi:glycosyltransferase involved in cell wall biosynthesis